MRDNTSRRLRAGAGCLLVVALSTIGCDKTTTPAPIPATSSVPIPPSGPLEKLEAPAEVVAFGGVSKTSAWLQRLGALLAKAKVPLDARVIQSTIKHELGLRSAAAVDLEKPLRVALVTGEGTAIDTIVMVGLRSEEQLVTALPENRQFDTEAGLWTYGGQDARYLLLFGKVAAIARRPGLLQRHRDFLLRLYGSDTGPQLRMKIQPGEPMARYRQALLALSSKRRSALERSLVPALEASAEFSELVVDLEAEPTGLRIQAKARATPASDLSKSLSELEGGKLRLLERLSAGTTAALGLRIPASLRAAWMATLSNLGSMAFIKKDTQTDAGEALRQFWSASDGELTVMLEPRAGEHGAGVTSLIGTKDAPKTRAAVKALLEIGRRHTGIEHQFNAYRVGKHPVHRVRLDTSKPEHRSFAPWAPVLNYDMAITDEAVIMAYGDGGDGAMTSWLATPTKAEARQGSFARHAASLGQAGKDPFFVAFLSPLRSLAALRWPGFTALSKLAKGIAHSPTQLMVCAAVHDGVLLIAADAPAAQLTEIATLAAARP